MHRLNLYVAALALAGIAVAALVLGHMACLAIPAQWVLVAPPNPVMHLEQPLQIGAYANHQACKAAKDKAVRDIFNLSVNPVRDWTEIVWINASIRKKKV
jgi:hypothetical protein